MLVKIWMILELWNDCLIKDLEVIIVECNVDGVNLMMDIVSLFYLVYMLEDS